MERFQRERDRVQDPTGECRARRSSGWITLSALAALFAGSCGCEREPEVATPSSLNVFLEGADPAPDRLALLVGIDHYAPDEQREFLDLEGCRNDVALMKELLVERFGFEERNVCVLLDEEATHRGIVEAFDRFLIDRTGERTQVFFYLSGHGSQVPDVSRITRAEYDGRDSTFLTWDSRSDGHDGERDLNDDELRCLLTALAGKGAMVTAITDSCHSGEILRGESDARAAPAGEHPLDREWVASFWPDWLELTDDSIERVAPVERYVHIAAAERDERAFEYRPEDLGGGRVTHGALTYVLANAMRNARRDATWDALVDDVAIRVADLKPQTVNARGTVDRLLFGGDFEGAPGYKSEWERDGSFLLIHAGWLHGLRAGSVVEVLDALGEVSLGTARVEKVNAAFARAVWAGEAPEEVLEGGLRALERSRPAGEPPLRIALEVPSLRDPLLGAPFDELITLAETDGPADYRVVRDERGAIRFETVEGLLVAAKLEPLAGGALPADLLERLEAAFRAELRWRAIHLLASERGAIHVELDLRTARPYELEKLHQSDDPRLQGSQPVELVDGDRRVRGAPSDAPFRVGIFEVTHSHERAAHVYVFSIEEGGTINQVYPSGRQDNPVAPKDPLEVQVAFIAHADWPFARPMRDRYLAIVTEHRIETDEFEAKGALRSAYTLPAILRRAFRPQNTRGRAEVVPDGWGSAVRDVLVMPPQ